MRMGYGAVIGGKNKQLSKREIRTALGKPAVELVGEVLDFKIGAVYWDGDIHLKSPGRGGGELSSIKHGSPGQIFVSIQSSILMRTNNTTSSQ